MLRAIEIRKEFNDKVALSDIDLTFPENGLVIIKGESGSGKTTLLNLLTANDFPTSGKILFNGVEITPKNSEEYRTQYCSNIYQDYMLIEDLTVKENIELVLQVVGQNYTVDDIKALLKKVDLPEEYLDKKVIKLSGGEKQRVAIARAVSKQNAMIFADEPTGNLDSKNGVIIMDLLKEISKERLVVVVSHNEKFNLEYADYTVKLIDGEIESEDLPKAEEEKVEEEEKIFDKKSKNLRPKTLARLAYWGFEKNRIKTVVSIIAFVVLCIFSTISLAATVADLNLSLAKTFDNADCKNVLITTLDDTDSESVEEFCSAFSMKKSLVYNMNIRKYEEDGLNLQYAVIYDEEVGADTELLYGKFPQKANEIAIPDYAAYYLTNYEEEYGTLSKAELIGKELKCNSFEYDMDIYYSFKIVGIFDDGKYLDNYEDLDNENKNYIKNTNFMAEVVFCGEGIEEIFNNNPTLFEKSAPGKIYSCVYNRQELEVYGYDEYAKYANTLKPLQKGEVYVDEYFAEQNALKIGDRIDVEYGIFNKYDGFIDAVFRKKGALYDLKIKGIVEPDIIYGNSVIFSQEDYANNVLINGHDKYNVTALFFNAVNIKNSYKFFNSISKEGRGIWTDKYNNLESHVRLENMSYINNFFYIIRQYKVLIIPFMVLSLLGMLAMGTVASSYLIASKEKSYIVLRSIGCGKKNIISLLILQLATLCALELVLGLILARISIDLLMMLFLIGVAGISNSLSSEVLLAIGWLPPIIVILVSFLNVIANILLKTKNMFSKSVIESKNK